MKKGFVLESMQGLLEADAWRRELAAARECQDLANYVGSGDETFESYSVYDK